MIEEWKDIAGYEGLYQVSNLGNVKRIKHIRYDNNHTLNERLLKQSLDKYGYLQLILHKNSKSKCFRVHRLVAENFLDNSNNYPCINHKDENKLNNNVDNLEWCTQSYNANYGNHNKNVSKALINNHNNSKKVLCVETNIIYLSTRDVERQLKINHTMISEVCRGKKQTTHGFHWKYII